MAEYTEGTGKRKKEGLLRDALHKELEDDLIVFRWLEQQISNKKAITACLLVLQGIAYSEEPPDANREEGKQK